MNGNKNDSASLSSSPGALLLRGGRVIDPARGVDAKMDLLLEGGKIKAIDVPGKISAGGSAVADLAGKIVTPGLLDIHVHLREPGQEWKETIASGAEAAVAGGFTTICCMPNTNPPIDNAQVTKFVLEKAEAAGLARVLPIGCISKGREGKGLAPLVELHEAGCVAFSDDGLPVAHAGLMRRALEYGLMFGAVMTVHEEEMQLSEEFSMNEGEMSVKLGLKGMPGASEDVMIARDIELARLTGGRVHFCHVSTARAVTLIRRAKEDGIPVTAEVTPHHLTLDESNLDSFDTNYKMSMPLRTRADIDALLKGVADGTIDCIASDHAPHEADSKNKEFDRASFGILGLQTTVPLILGLVREGKLTLPRAIAALTVDPARCFNLKKPSLAAGEIADITVIDPELKLLHTAEYIRSKSKNTPFIGMTLQGAAVQTYIAGRKVYEIDG